MIGFSLLLGAVSALALIYSYCVAGEKKADKVAGGIVIGAKAGVFALGVVILIAGPPGPPQLAHLAVLLSLAMLWRLTDKWRAKCRSAPASIE